MKLSFPVARQALLIAVPVISSLAAIAAPAHADTFSFSSTDATIGDFSQPVNVLDTFTDSDTITISTGPGFVNADANADAVLVPYGGFGFSFGRTNGSGVSYQGAASGRSTLIGNFLVNAHQAFSFGFSSQLQLATAITTPLTETATALGKIQFSLYDNSTDQLLDKFGLFGLLNGSKSDSDPFSVQSSDYISLIDNPQIVASTPTQTLASKTFAGSYHRTFDGSLNLRLESFQINETTVAAVPEPDYIFGTVALLLVLPVARYWRSKQQLS